MIPGRKNTDSDSTPLAAAVANPVTFENLLTAVGARRDRDAFVRLFSHFAPRIKSFLMKGGMTPAQADDLAQDTMLTVWRKAPTYNPKLAGASTWIFTIARNRRIDLLRKTARPEPDPSDPVLAVDPGPAPDTALRHRQETRLVADALDKLPPEQADLVRKVYFEDKSHSDIAAETSLPLGTVKSRLRLAMDRLRQNLGESYK